MMVGWFRSNESIFISLHVCSTVPDIEQMDVGKDRNHMEKSTPASVQWSKMERTEVSEPRSEAEVTSQSEIVGCSVVCDSSDGDVVKSDSGDGVKVSNVDCGTGGEGVNSDGVKGAEGGGGGGGSTQSEQQKQLWAAVKANPSDFTSWTTLLQIVEQNVRDRGVLCVCACVRACVCVCVCVCDSNDEPRNVLSIPYSISWILHVRRSVSSSNSTPTATATGRSILTL